MRGILKAFVRRAVFVEEGEVGQGAGEAGSSSDAMPLYTRRRPSQLLQRWDVGEQKLGKVEQPARRRPTADHDGGPQSEIDRRGDLTLKNGGAAKPDEEGCEDGEPLPGVTIGDPTRTTFETLYLAQEIAPGAFAAMVHLSFSHGGR